MSLFKIFRNYNVNKLQFGKKNYYVPTEMYIQRQNFVPPIVMQDYEMSKEEIDKWFNHLYISSTKNDNNE
jgi:hypothetical protein